MKKKVLIIYATAGMGHVKASEAIEDAFHKNYPDVEVNRVDILQYCSPLWQKILRDGYHYISAKQPALWKLFYKHFNKQSRQHTLHNLARFAVNKKFFKDVKAFDPDFFIATHPLPVRLLNEMEKELAEKLPTATMVTDFGYHSYWIAESVNYYFVASDFSQREQIKNGTQAQKIVVTGIPIEPKFSQQLDRSALQKKMKLDPNKRTLLIVGGQFNFDQLTMMLEQVQARHKDSVQFLVVAGRDHDLEAALNNSELGKDESINVFGFVDNMEEMMSVSDLIFSKAGGLTVSECMAKGLPMVINKVIPGQEEDNVEYLTKAGAAIKAEDFESTIAAVNDLLDDHDRLAQMQQAAKSIGKPQAAKTIVDFVVEKVK